MSFVKADKSILYNSELTSDEKVALIAMQDRLSLSMTKGDTFKQGNEYFIIYAQEVMAKVINKSVRTIGRLYSALESKGMIRRKKRFNASDLIFLTIEDKITDRDKTKLQTSKTKSNNTNINKLNTINTELSKNQKWNDWARMANQRLGLSCDVVESFRSITQSNVKRSYELFTLINNAKKHVINEYGVKGDITRYETNEALDGQLSQQMHTINNLAPKDANRDKYLMRSYINFFKEAFGLSPRNWLCESENFRYQMIIDHQRAEFDKNRDDKLVIPMFKIQ